MSVLGVVDKPFTKTLYELVSLPVNPAGGKILTSPRAASSVAPVTVTTFT